MSCDGTLLEFREGTPVEGILEYRARDYAFAFLPSDPAALRTLVGDQGTTSLVFGSVQVEVSVDSGRCLFAWGYSPRQGWRPGSISGLPDVRSGACFTSGVLLRPGVSIGVIGSTDILVSHDAESGKVWLRSKNGEPAKTAVEIAEGVAVLIAADSRPVGLLLQPG